jgi:Uma2 family endonuclease
MSMITTTKRISLVEYERMVALGEFDDRTPMELLDGELVPKMTQNPPHCVADDALGLELARKIPRGWCVRGGKPVRLPPQDSEPEPDRCVVRGSLFDYATRHPGPADIALVVEVSDATLDTDRGRKLAGYATAGVPIYWIVNLIDRQVEVYTKPIPGLGQYAAQTNYQVGQRVPIVIQNRRRIGTIEVDLIMPPVAGS